MDGSKYGTIGRPIQTPGPVGTSLHVLYNALWEPLAFRGLRLHEPLCDSQLSNDESVHNYGEKFQKLLTAGVFKFVLCTDVWANMLVR